MGAVRGRLRLNGRCRLAIAVAALVLVSCAAATALGRAGGPTPLGRFGRQVADVSAAGVLGRKA